MLSLPALKLSAILLSRATGEVDSAVMPQRPDARPRYSLLAIEDFSITPISKQTPKIGAGQNQQHVTIRFRKSEELSSHDGVLYEMTLSAKMIGNRKQRSSWKFEGRLNPAAIIEATAQLPTGWYRFAASITFKDGSGALLPYVAFGESRLNGIF